jgi:predicted MPP superfamily phosphohydrolase
MRKHIYQRGHADVIRRRHLRLPANTDGTARGLRFVLASDVHAREDWFPRECVAALVDRINSVEDADGVLLVGDFVGNEASAIDWSADEYARIEAPTFATLGNHDYWTDPERVTSHLERAGIEVLTNRNLEFTAGGGGRICLAGIDSCWGGNPDAEQALHGVPMEEPVVVLGHEPWLATMHQRFLHLAGHTHHGQVRLPIPLIGTALTRLWMPRFSQPYPRRLVHRAERSWVYTTAGVGYSTLSWRLTIPPEIVVIDV